MKLLVSVYSAFSRPVCRLKRALHRIGVLRAARAPLPVLSVGNLALGGSEKTPLALDLLGYFLEIGRKPALVSRGYKSAWERTGGVLSNGRTITGTWREGGDEPFLAARRHPGAGVFIGRDRLASCRRAREAGFDVAILDDEVGVMPKMDENRVVPIERLKIRSGLPFVRHVRHQIVGQGGLGKRYAQFDALDLGFLLAGNSGQPRRENDDQEKKLSFHHGSSKRARVRFNEPNYRLIIRAL